MRTALRYASAVAAVAAGFIAWLAVTAWVGPGLPTFITLYPAVIAVALLAGPGPGLLATALTCAAVGYWIMPPVGQFFIASSVDRLALVLFFAMGLFISAVAEAYRRSRLKAAAYDRDQALIETRRENAFLANLLENTSQPFAVGYPDGRLGRFNRAFAEITGYTADELRTLDWAAVLTPPEWRGLERQQLEELNRTGLPARYEKEYIRKDGTRVPIELFVHLVRDAAGNPEYYYSFLADITERKRAEEALREALAKAEAGERLLEALMEHVPEGITIADAAGQLQMVSRHGQELLGSPHAGKSVDEVVRDWKVFHADGTTPMAVEDLPLVRAMQKGEIVLDARLVQVGARGEKLHLACNAAPIRDASGKIVGGIVAWRDITELQKAEEKQAQFARQRQLALDAARLGWWHYDPVTRMANWDDGYRAIFGVSGHTRLNDEILAQLIHPEDLPGLWAKVEAALNPVDPRPFAAEYRIRRPDGAVRWIEAHGIATFEGEGPQRKAVSFVGTVADITESKAAGEQIQRHMEELSRANEELGRFNRVAVGRELRMVELKRQVNALSARLGEPPLYPPQAEEEHP